MKALHLALVALLVASALGAGVPGGDATVPATASSGPAATPPAATGDDPPRAVARPVAGRIDAPNATPIAPRSNTTIGPRQIRFPDAPTGTVHAVGVQPGVENRSSFHEAYVDLGPVLGFESGNASRELETLHSIERAESAETDAERAELLRASVERMERRADELGAEQRALLESFARNETGAEELLVGLARIDREARGLDDRRERVWAAANRSGVELDESRLAELGRELDLYSGPVREHAAGALAGGAPTHRYYVAAGPRSVVLSTLAGDEYLREGYRGDLRDLGGGELDDDTATGVVERGYPAIWRARDSVSTEGGTVSRVVVSYPGGSLSASVGSGNRRVFADEHRRTLATSASSTSVTNTRDGLQLTVDRTYPGGPLRIELADQRGNRVNASVTLGPAGGRSAAVGHTGEDGVLWTLSPDQRFTVVAIRDQNVVFLTMDPRDTPNPIEGN